MNPATGEEKSELQGGFGNKDRPQFINLETGV